jgi:hypothetical protein
MTLALRWGFLLPLDDICNIGEPVILSETVEKPQNWKIDACK